MHHAFGMTQIMINAISGGLGITRTAIKNREQNQIGKAVVQTNDYTNSFYNGPAHLRIGGLVSRALDKGANVTIYKSDSYTEENPMLRIVTTSADGEEKEQLIDPRTIDISNATQNEMLALNAYLVDQGKLDGGVPTSILTGTDITPTDLAKASNLRSNFLDIARDMMEMQYKAHNYSGYAIYSKMLGVYESFMGRK